MVWNVRMKRGVVINSIITIRGPGEAEFVGGVGRTASGALSAREHLHGDGAFFVERGLLDARVVAQTVLFGARRFAARALVTLDPN